MKLRIRHGKRTEKVEASGEDSIETLEQKIAACFGVPPDSFKLSLNGKDAITEENTSQISALGLVSGDLLKLITDEGSRLTAVTQQSQSSSNSEKEPQSVPADQETETRKKVKGQQSDECHPGTSSATAQQIKGATKPQNADPVEDNGPAQGSKVMEEQSNEIMFVRDCIKDRMPLRLREMWQSNRPQSPEEALSLVLHVLMLETGFTLHSHDKSASPSAALPSTWREDGCCQLSYVHQHCDQSHVCRMACFPLRPLVVITGVVSHDQKSPFSFHVLSKEYIKEWRQVLTLCNTANLSRIFKDTIAHPVTHKIRENCGLAPLHGLLVLPAEIQIEVMTYLDVRSILNLSEVCHTLRGLTQDETLWRHLCLRDFKAGMSMAGSSSSWKEVYRLYAKEKERERIEEEWRRYFVPTYPEQYSFIGIRRSSSTIANDGSDIDVQVMFTGIDEQFIPDLSQKLEMLGGCVVTDIQECTHLVTTKVICSVKFLCGICCSRYIISPMWIEESYKRGWFLNEANFRLLDLETESRLSFKLEESLQTARRKKLFTNMVLYATPSVQPPCYMLREIVQCAGGTLLDKQPPMAQIKRVHLSLGRHSFIVVSCDADMPLCQKLIRSNIDTYNVQFILTSVLRQQLDFISFRYNLLGSSSVKGPCGAWAVRGLVKKEDSVASCGACREVSAGHPTVKWHSTDWQLSPEMTHTDWPPYPEMAHTDWAFQCCDDIYKSTTLP